MYRRWSNTYSGSKIRVYCRDITTCISLLLLETYFKYSEHLKMRIINLK